MKYKLVRLIILSAFLVLAAIVGMYVWAGRNLPDLIALPEKLHQPSVQIVDRNGKLLYESIQSGEGRNKVIALSEIPKFCQQATIATEDRSFYSNPGVDIKGVVRAAWINMKDGETIAGGSTITQQVARNLLLQDGQRSVRRKLREIILAWELTRQFSKEDILALYLNQTYYGGMAYGIEAASQTFFGKPAARLDLAECALIAGLPQSPAQYNPFANLEKARKRQAVVLSLMRSAGFISKDDERFAQDEPLVLAESPYPIIAPHFVMLVRNQLDDLFSSAQIYGLGGLVVRTTLDADWQRHAEAAVTHQIDQLNKNGQKLGHRVHNAALVALDPHNGDVLAMVGSPDYFDVSHAGAINMAVTPRQPGSALKPLVYAAALDPLSPTGGWTAATMILDVGSSFLTNSGKAYSPSNYDLKEHGPVLVREALASSLNIPAVKALQHVGLDALFELSSKLGITTLTEPEKYDLSLALGGGAVKLIDLTAAYGAFANGGSKVTPRWILDVRGTQGEIVYSAPATIQQQVLDARVAWLINDILSDPNARRLGFGANSLLRIDRPAAVKTGTTSNFHDNWTIGYTPDLVVGVWSGNTDYQPMREVNGLSGAAPIWHEFIRIVLSGLPKRSFVRPPGMVRAEICSLSGLLPSDLCPYRRYEWFIPGTQPEKIDTFFQQIRLNKETGFPASEGTPPDMIVRVSVLDLPIEARDWARQQGLRLLSDFNRQNQLLGTGTRKNEKMESPNPPNDNFFLISPAPGTVFRLSNLVSTEAQRIRLAVRADQTINHVTFWVDGGQIGEINQTPFEIWWMITPGEHTVWAEANDSYGNRLSSAKVNFIVLP